MTLNPESYPQLLPTITDLNRPFWDGCRAGELRVQRCGSCGTLRFPESFICPNCLSSDHAWVPVSGRGTLWSWITMHQRYFDAFAGELPYNVAFVRLDEGLHLVTSLIDPPVDLSIDAGVEVVFVEVPGDRMIPKFRVLR
jgi:uncharacterized OB-fold protein